MSFPRRKESAPLKGHWATLELSDYPQSEASEGEGPPFLARYIDPDSIYKPPCECADCGNGFYTVEEQTKTPSLFYVGKISDHDAKQVAGTLVKDIQERRAYLMQRPASHGDTIINRWKKKSQAKRQELLLSAVPEMYEHQ